MNIRLVVATNQSLRQLVDAGRFREDLYYRLAGVELQVPSLRKRRDDVLELAEYFLARHHRFRQLSLSDGPLKRSSVTAGRATCGNCSGSSSGPSHSLPGT